MILDIDIKGLKLVFFLLIGLLLIYYFSFSIKNLLIEKNNIESLKIQQDNFPYINKVALTEEERKKCLEDHIHLEETFRKSHASSLDNFNKN